MIVFLSSWKRKKATNRSLSLTTSCSISSIVWVGQKFVCGLLVILLDRKFESFLSRLSFSLHKRLLDLNEFVLRHNVIDLFLSLGQSREQRDRTTDQKFQ